MLACAADRFASRHMDTFKDGSSAGSRGMMNFGTGLQLAGETLIQNGLGFHSLFVFFKLRLHQHRHVGIKNHGYRLLVHGNVEPVVSRGEREHLDLRAKLL